MNLKQHLTATALAAVGLFGGEAVYAGKPLKLTVSVSPSTIVEGSTATGTVTHNNSSVSSPVTVTLSSNDTTEAIVAATVTIPAGTNTVNFAVTAINDNIADGSQPVTITTAATSYASASTNVTVKDAPTFQYVLTLPALPADGTGTVYENDLNNRGQMVGWYSTAEGRKGYIYASQSSSIIDLTALNLPGIPDGYQITSVVGINEHQVLVGYLTNDFGASGNRIVFAVDFAAVNPVVDLLPDMLSTRSYGSKINENGDILGVYTDELGAWRGYIYNPGLYNGDPLVRAARDGIPQDLRDGITSSLPMGFSPGFNLNNPVGNIPAQVAGTDPNGIAFRYTTGLQPLSETFPEIDLDGRVRGINDAGTFCGVMNVTTVVKRITRTSRVPFRYTSIVGQLPGNSGYSSASDINNAGDIIDGDDVYRDTWGWRQLTDLPVIGYDADVLLWLTSSPWGELISDRGVTSDDVGHIAGEISISTGGVSYYTRSFVLTPVPVL